MTGSAAHAMPQGLTALDTPRLLLDASRLERNAEAMRKRCQALGVTLRPHLKTSKSLDVARVATGGGGPVAVSTLKEAEYFAAGGYRDILYATTVTPSRIARVNRIQAATGARILCLVDHVPTAREIARAAEAMTTRLACLIEIDCGEHRSGLAPGSADLIPVAQTLAASGQVDVLGVMTHAGHSYRFMQYHAVQALAEAERRAAVAAAARLREAGLPCPVVSVGSTPTVYFAKHLEGVTEVRCGVYLFWDLAQYSRHLCDWDEMAVSVLATVIGHNVQGPSLILDAGALALSKDMGANTFLPDVHYGYVCDPHTLERYGALSVETVHQEHGTVPVPDESWFLRLPVGSLVRILPNHACLTCAAYEAYDVVRDGAVVDRWPRINGW